MKIRNPLLTLSTGLSLALATPLAVIAVAPAPAYAQQDPVQSAFAGLNANGRRAVQEKLQAGGFYSSRIDGAYGAGTRNGLLNAAAYVADNSRGTAVYDLRRPESARNFVNHLARGDLDMWLWGEGGECDGC